MIEIDDVANMYATLPGSDPDAKRIVMASHVDSVKNGGNYDGILASCLPWRCWRQYTKSRSRTSIR